MIFSYIVNSFGELEVEFWGSEHIKMGCTPYDGSHGWSDFVVAL